MRGSRHFVVNLVDRFAAPANRPRGTRHVDTQGIADRLAHVEGFQQGQLFGVLIHQVGKTDHDALALRRSHTRPNARLESGAGIRHGQLGIGQIAAGHQAEQASVDRADALKGGPGDGGAVLAMNKGAAFDLQVLGALLPVGTSQASHSYILYR